MGVKNRQAFFQTPVVLEGNKWKSRKGKQNESTSQSEDLEKKDVQKHRPGCLEVGETSG